MLTRTMGALGILTSGLMIAALGPNAAAQGSKADYDRANHLYTLKRGKISNADVRVAWSAEEDFVIFKNGKELTRLDLTSTKETPAVDMARVARIVGAKRSEFTIINFALPQDDVLWLLVKHKKTVQVVKCGPGPAMMLAAPETDHPFRAAPISTRAARSGKGRGSMSIVFVNRNGGPVKSYWVNDKRERKAYGVLQNGTTTVFNTFDGHAWLFTDENGRAVCAFIANKDKPVILIKRSQKTDKKKPQKQNPWNSPDGKYRAFYKDYNLYLRDLRTKKESQLSTDGTKDNPYTSQPSWSPDSSRLVAIQRKEAQRHTVYIVESTPKDQLQPKLHSFNYLKPGDQIAQPKPRLFDIANKKQIPVSDNRFKTPWQIRDFHWSNDSRDFYFTYNQRGHQVLRVVAINGSNGRTRTVIEDKSKTFIDYSRKFWCHHIAETNEIIWMSERDGWNHLYLVDRKTGKVKNQITKGKWVVQGVQAVDDEKRELLLRVLGVYREQDPYYVHYARVKFDGSGFTLLTKGDGTHQIEFSPKKNYIIDTYSRVNLAPVKELRRAKDGKLIKELAKTDMSKLVKAGWKVPEPFVAKGRDGKTNIYGVIYRPTNLDPKKHYPVIEAIYAGPHGQFVPKDFGGGRINPLTELGFIVVQIDGMGTNWRSKAFHDVCWRNLADAGFPDRKRWIRAAAKTYPYMDITRVGIYGGSAGGQNAMRALIDHHDLYKVAVADCGCHDNRMDKIWWNEAWMGWPINKEAYDRSSNAVQAKKMEGHLMLMVGELDRNVDPASTMQVVDALIKADKDFDLIVFPGKGHCGGSGSPYGKRRMWDFFVRHLLGREPRWEK